MKPWHLLENQNKIDTGNKGVEKMDEDKIDDLIKNPDDNYCAFCGELWNSDHHFGDECVGDTEYQYVHEELEKNSGDNGT